MTKNTEKKKSRRFILPLITLLSAVILAAFAYSTVENIRMITGDSISDYDIYLTGYDDMSFYALSSIYYGSYLNVRDVPSGHREFAAFGRYSENAYFARTLEGSGMEDTVKKKTALMEEALKDTGRYRDAAKRVEATLFGGNDD